MHDHVEYLRVLSYIGRRGETFYANQSINGALNRLLFNGSSLEWQYHEFAPPHPLVYAGTLAAFVILVAAALKRPARGAGGVVDLSIAALATTLTAPLAWEHHYGILLPIYAAVTPFVIVAASAGTLDRGSADRQFPGGRRTTSSSRTISPARGSTRCSRICWAPP